jgi:hypothetical protein
MATLSGLVTFILASVLCLFAAGMILPKSFVEIPINLVFVSGNVGGLVSFLVAGLCGGSSYRGTLKRYKRKEQKKRQSKQSDS